MIGLRTKRLGNYTPNDQKFLSSLRHTNVSVSIPQFLQYFLVKLTTCRLVFYALITRIIIIRIHMKILQNRHDTFTDRNLHMNSNNDNDNSSYQSIKD